MSTEPSKKITLQDLETSLPDFDRIAKEGADRDGALSTMAKGMTEGFSALIALLKGAQPPPPKKDEEPPKKDKEPDGDEGKGGEGDKDGDEGKPADEGEGGGEKEPEDGEKGDEKDDEDKGGPGYEDMQMGGGAPGEFVDATEYVLAMEQTLKAQGQELKHLRKAVGELKTMVSDLTGGLVQTLAPLSKAVLETRQGMLELPAAVHDPGFSARRAVVAHGLETAAARTDGLPVQKLTKAMSRKVITEDEYRHYKAFGVFPGTADEAKATFDRVSAV